MASECRLWKPAPFSGLLALVLVLVHYLQAAKADTLPDVCTQEEYTLLYKDELCPDVFQVAVLAFNPLGPGVLSEVTIIINPSTELTSNLREKQRVAITLPGFKPKGEVDPENALNRVLTVTPMNVAAEEQNPSLAYNTVENAVVEPTALFDTQLEVLNVFVVVDKAVKQVDTEFRVCCLTLPLTSPPNNPAFEITAFVPERKATIAKQPIKNSPEIDRGNFWDHLQIDFDPPLSKHSTTIAIKIRPANDLSDELKIIVSLPGVTRVGDESGLFDFNTAGNDWMKFKFYGKWNNTEQTMTFTLRKGVTFYKGETVTLRTTPGEYVLPIEVPPNWGGFTVEARSNDLIDNIVPATSVMQSNAVPHVRNFTYSRLRYLESLGNGHDVELSFQTNRPMYAGTFIMLRLAGFGSEVVEVPILGDLKDYFTDKIALFDMPKNELLLRVNKTLYSDEFPQVVVLQSLKLPPALYEDDISLLIWNSDKLAERQSIQLSPEVGSGAKLFLRSEIDFMPQVPEMASNIKFTLLPSIIFYQGDQIILHLYGFRCNRNVIPLSGPEVHRIENQQALWDLSRYILIMNVAPQQIIDDKTAIVLEISIDVGFRLPDKLSENDGILMIEGGGAYIAKEAMKKTPKIGPSKEITHSSLVFESINADGSLSLSVAKLVFSFVSNTDILPNTTIYFKLGGLKREEPHSSGYVKLSGINSPMFENGMGYWNASNNVLTIKMVQGVYIRTGKMMTFFLERDQFFKLPYAMYPNDPSLFLYIPEAGIHKVLFDQTTRVNREEKRFQVSELQYGLEGEVPYPNNVSDIFFRFLPNVELPSGSVIRLHLPNFTCRKEKVPLSAGKPYDQGYKLFLKEGNIHYADWNQMTSTLDFTVAVGKVVKTVEQTEIRLRKDSEDPSNDETQAGFRLPGQLNESDSRLIIESIQNQIIKPEPIKTSPRVVARTFQTSSFSYTPREKESTFLLQMVLQPTVQVDFKNDMEIKLPGFWNALKKDHIHLTGPDANSIKSATADWNETTSVLTLKVNEDSPIPAFHTMHLKIEESQGFILPRTLYANDPRLTIRSLNNIKHEQIKISPMVGDGPFEEQRFCMYQYERGTRTTNPFCQIENCEPPVSDPCSRTELIRCKCEELSEDLLPLTIHGFQLYEDDIVGFMPMEHSCSDWGTHGKMSTGFSSASKVAVNEDRNRLAYSNISSIDTGHFRICFNHFGDVFDVGTVIVRPSCTSPLVMVEGTCVEHCPPMKIPIAGECQRDPVVLAKPFFAKPLDKQAIMVSIRMNNPSAIRNHIWNRSSEDPERKYFVYRYTYELAHLLAANPDRFQVASISEGSVIVNTVFTTYVEDSTDPEVTTARSPMGLLSLLRALQADASSILYHSSFFKHIVTDYTPDPIPVHMCPDEKFRTICPYMDTIISSNGGFTICIVSILGVAGVVSLICVGAWRVDFDSIEKKDNTVYADAAKDPSSLDPTMQAEYARSWLEGRFMGENWQKTRSRRMGPAVQKLQALPGIVKGK